MAHWHAGGEPLMFTVRGHEIPTSERVYHRRNAKQNWKTRE